jgi:hypothetical protein
MCGELVAAGWAARRLSFRDNGRDALRLQLLTSDAVVLLRRDTADTAAGCVRCAALSLSLSLSLSLCAHQRRRGAAAAGHRGHQTRRLRDPVCH